MQALQAHRRLALGLVFGLGVCGMLLTGGTADSNANPHSLVDRVTRHENRPRRVRPKPIVADPAANVVSPAPLAESKASSNRERVPPPRRTALRVYSCPTAHRDLALRIERAFETAHRGIDLILSTRTDRDCVGHLVMGNADVAMISTTLSKSERARGLRDRILAHQIVVPIVHASNPIKLLTIAHLKAILDGKARSWRDVGGDDTRIQPVCQNRGRIDDHAERSLRVRGKAAANAVFVNEPRDIPRYVATSPRAFGLVRSVDTRDQEGVRVLQIRNTTPTAKDLERGAWPLGATLRVVTRQKPNAATQAFLDYLRTESSQKVLRQAFVLPTRK